MESAAVLPPVTDKKQEKWPGQLSSSRGLSSKSPLLAGMEMSLFRLFGLQQFLIPRTSVKLLTTFMRKGNFLNTATVSCRSKLPCNTLFLIQF